MRAWGRKARRTRIDARDFLPRIEKNLPAFCLRFCLPTYLSTCLLDCLPIYVPIYLPACLSACLLACHQYARPPLLPPRRHITMSDCPLTDWLADPTLIYLSIQSRIWRGRANDPSLILYLIATTRRFFVFLASFIIVEMRLWNVLERLKENVQFK